MEQLRDCGYRGRIAATSWYPEEAEELEKAGVEFAFNIYQEAGEGLASDLRGRVADNDK